MAQKQSKGHKIGRQSRNDCDKSQKSRTARNKTAEIERAGKLAGRPDSQVSANCLKKRAQREKLKGLNSRERRMVREDGRIAGERQFGEKAKPWHLHQREHGLATALTPKEWDAKVKREKEKKKEQKDASNPFAQIST